MPFKEPPIRFSRFYRGWNRVEPRSRSDDFAQGLRAAFADPLWALGRAWQFAQLKGEDAGTPIKVSLNYERSPLDQVKLGDAGWQQIDTVPLEVLVERESVAWDWRLRVRTGQQFQRIAGRLLGDGSAAYTTLIDAVRAACPIALPDVNTEAWAALDEASRRYVRFMHGRAINGETLWTQRNALGIPADVLTAFQTWWGRLYSRGPADQSAAWRPAQLEYEYRIRSRLPGLPGPLHAASYRSGTVDWTSYAIEQRPNAAMHREPTVHPTPVHATFAGQPMRRWWEFEDRGMDFGAFDVGKTDIGRMLLMEFALLFGDDWFVVPLRGKSNEMLRVMALHVHDCFGLTTQIDPARDANANPLLSWDVFSIAPDRRADPASNFLHVPPISGTREESGVIEQILMSRDEDANCVFAMEQVVPNGLGEPTGGFAAHLETSKRWREYLAATAEESDETEAAESETTSALPPPPVDFTLATEVPLNWIPFIPIDTKGILSGATSHSVKLRRAAMVARADADERRAVSALSRLLHGSTPLEWVEEEAVGRAGVRIELRRQRTRSATGETFCWLSRKISTGRGEVRSGLRFDAVTGKE